MYVCLWEWEENFYDATYREEKEEEGVLIQDPIFYVGSNAFTQNKSNISDAETSDVSLMKQKHVCRHFYVYHKYVNHLDLLTTYNIFIS